jgi:hypothetical protein
MSLEIFTTLRAANDNEPWFKRYGAFVLIALLALFGFFLATTGGKH